MSNKPFGLHPDDTSAFDTYTARVVSPLHLDPEQIDINDIAHSLALQCRFNGHCIRFYSVAEHSVLASEVVSGYKYKDSTVKRMTELAALLHDASEAYIGDIIRPLKHNLKGLKEIESKIEGAIMAKFKVVGAEWLYVLRADEVMVSTECKQIMMSRGIGWEGLPEPLTIYLPVWSWQESENMFLDKFYDLRVD